MHPMEPQTSLFEWNLRYIFVPAGGTLGALWATILFSTVIHGWHWHWFYWGLGNGMVRASGSCSSGGGSRWGWCLSFAGLCNSEFSI